MSLFDWFLIVQMFLVLYAVVVLIGHMRWHSKSAEERRQELEDEWKALHPDKVQDGVIPFIVDEEDE